MKLLPTILTSVQTIESIVPLPAAGKAKLDLILGTVSDVYNTEQAIQKEITSDKLMALVTSTVSRAVATFNSLGLFRKTTKA